jgi:hypothetical protein
MSEDDYGYFSESVSEQLILILWVSVGILAFIVPLLYFALGLG